MGCWGGDTGAVPTPDPLDQALAGQDGWFLQQTKKQRVKVGGGTPGWGEVGHPKEGCVSPGCLLTPLCPPLPAAPPPAADEALAGPGRGGGGGRWLLQPHL